MSTTTSAATSPTTDSVTQARAAFLRGDLRAILRPVNGSSNIDVERVWCLAMDAIFGPVGLHESCYGPDDLPLAEVRAKPMHRWGSETVGEWMEKARAELATALGLHAQALEPRTFLPSNWGRRA
jgi:hypothetical protein